MTNLKSLEIWMVQNFAEAGILFSVMSLLLHVGRSYFERILSRLTLRGGGYLVAALCGTA